MFFPYGRKSGVKSTIGGQNFVARVRFIWRTPLTAGCIKSFMLAGRAARV